MTLDPQQLQGLYDFAVDTLEAMDENPKTYRPSGHIPRDVLNCGDARMLCAAVVMLLAERYQWIAPPGAADAVMYHFQQEH